MSATLAGAYKAFLEAGHLGVVCYRDGRPATGWSYPYMVVTEGIARTPQQHGDRRDPNRHGGTEELVQVDLVQQVRKPGARAGRLEVAEDRDLPNAVERRLESGWPDSYGTPAVRIFGARVVTGNALPIVDNERRTTWTVAVQRDT